MLAAMGLLLNVAAGATGPRARGAPAAARATAAAARGDDARARTGTMAGERAAKRIVIAAGGTAGHVVPALAVADALRADGAEVAFIGGDRAEAHARARRPASSCTRSTVEGMSRSHPLQALRALAPAALALPRSRSLLRSLRARRGDWAAAATWRAPVGLAALRCGCRWC